MDFEDFMENVVKVFEVIGVIVMALGSIVAFVGAGAARPIGRSDVRL